MPTRQEILESTDYEPYNFRIRKNQQSCFQALVNLVKGIVGTGLLAMPEAYRNSGFVTGTVGNVIISAVLAYCLQLLGMYYFCKRDKIAQVTYPEAIKEGFKMGPHCLRKFADISPYMVNFFVIVYQVGIMAVYVVFCGTNIKEVIDSHTPHSKHLSMEMYMTFLLLPFLLISYVKNLKLLAPFSNIANWLMLIALLCMYYFVFETVEPIEERSLFVHINYLPLFMGTTMFSVLAIGAILSIELNLRDGRQWGGICGVLNIGIFIVTILNIFTGFFGYWKYGQKTEASITLNLPHEHPLAQTVQILFVVVIFLSYPLQAYPATEILWEQYVESYMETSQNKQLWDYILRSILVLISYVMGVLIPKLGLFISLFGAFCLSFLGVIFPPLLDLCIRWPDDLGKGKIILIRDIVLILFGFVAFGTGTYTAIKTIIDQLVVGRKK